MAIQIKSMDVITKKFVARGGAAGGDYQTGVQNPRRPWQATTVAAAPTWAAGVSAAVSNQMFTKGVNKAGDAKWAAQSSGKGATRFGPGIQAAGPYYNSGFQPYHDVIAGVNLPPRGVKGDPNNNARVAAVTQALRAKKLSG